MTEMGAKAVCATKLQPAVMGQEYSISLGADSCNKKGGATESP